MEMLLQLVRPTEVNSRRRHGGGGAVHVSSVAMSGLSGFLNSELRKSKFS